MTEKNKVKKNEEKTTKTKDVIIFSTIILLFLGILVYSIVTKNSGVSPSTVADCLSEKNAVFYGSKFCPHCQDQKKMFGEEMRKFTEVECSVEIEKCQEAGITAYPTWVIDGRTFVGARDLKTLHEIACN